MEVSSKHLRMKGAVWVPKQVNSSLCRIYSSSLSFSFFKSLHGQVERVEDNVCQSLIVVVD